MIPTINHSRCNLYSYMTDFEDGACVFGVSSDIYPELFELTHHEIVKKAPKGWKVNPKGGFRYLWFPPNMLDEGEIESITDWRSRFKQYVLIGLNKYLSDHFTNELDFCLALDYNFDAAAEKRTIYGEAEFQLKYKQSRPSRHALQAALVEAFENLPIPVSEKEAVVISCIPSDPEERNVGRELAVAVADSLDLDFVQADLLCDKSAMKDLSVTEKIPEWNKMYDCKECVNLQTDIEDLTVVIIDDLYQSGATMWCYAKYLKRQGAKYVLGLPCVKSLRDSDNR